MNNAIFLSASVPDPRREPEHAATADTVAIASAVSALLFVVLGRRPIIWGGHPAITPMVVEMCKSLDVNYQSWVGLYQSLYFFDKFPEDNDAIENITLTKKFDTREGSLLHMRQTMLQDHHYDAAVYIGGMSGIIEESVMFSEIHNKGKKLPMHSTGGACMKIKTNVDGFADEITTNMDYINIFHKYLKIDPAENRQLRPVPIT